MSTVDDRPAEFEVEMNNGLMVSTVDGATIGLELMSSFANLLPEGITWNMRVDVARKPGDEPERVSRGTTYLPSPLFADGFDNGGERQPYPPPPLPDTR